MTGLHKVQPELLARNQLSTSVGPFPPTFCSTAKSKQYLVTFVEGKCTGLMGWLQWLLSLFCLLLRSKRGLLPAGLLTEISSWEVPPLLVLALAF